jgi:amidase/6-aminohexanoate-cyclic-dimer hydrolase
MSLPRYDDHDALGLAEQVAHGTTSAEELLDEAIRRTEAVNGEVGAVVMRHFETARDAIKEGLPDGPLRGVPFLIKDLVLQVEGTRTTNGCRLFEDAVADHDSELVARYRRAGLVIFGKTHSPEFGLTTSSESLLFGQTRNPWSPAHTAGGSSGGAAAAVAAGILPLANASDGGGSIRIPASCCGVFGLKPTRARTPLAPDAGEGWSGMSTVHAVSRSVRDSAALLDASAGPAEGDPYWAPPPERSYLEEVSRDVGRLRIAVQPATWNGTTTHADCQAARDDVAQLCRELGHEVVGRPLEIGAERLRAATLPIIAANLRFTLEDRASQLGRDIAEGDVEPITFLVAASALGRNSAEYARSVRELHAIGRDVEYAFRDCDVILSPTMAAPPSEIGLLSLSNPDIGSQISALNQSVGYTQLFNASGHPAMSVPLHWNGDGLPIGVQFATRFGDEGRLFRLAAQLESARPWRERHAPIHASDR